MVSLFPADTYKGHPVPRDLAEMLAAMKPAFVRFPGGCYVEGNELCDAFRWKKTIGDIAERPGHYNLWGYYSNDGSGLPRVPCNSAKTSGPSRSTCSIAG